MHHLAKDHNGFLDCSYCTQMKTVHVRRVDLALADASATTGHIKVMSGPFAPLNVAESRIEMGSQLVHV